MEITGPSSLTDSKQPLNRVGAAAWAQKEASQPLLSAAEDGERCGSWQTFRCGARPHGGLQAPRGCGGLRAGRRDPKDGRDPKDRRHPITCPHHLLFPQSTPGAWQLHRGCPQHRVS